MKGKYPFFSSTMGSNIFVHYCFKIKLTLRGSEVSGPSVYPWGMSKRKFKISQYFLKKDLSRALSKLSSGINVQALFRLYLDQGLATYGP